MLVSTVILVLRRLRQKKNEFDASLDYIKKKKKQTTPPADAFSFGPMTVLVLSRMAWHFATAALVKKRPQTKV